MTAVTVNTSQLARRLARWTSTLHSAQDQVTVPPPRHCRKPANHRQERHSTLPERQPHAPRESRLYAPQPAGSLGTFAALGSGAAMLAATPFALSLIHI